MCNCRGLVLIFLIFLFYMFVFCFFFPKGLLTSFFFFWLIQVFPIDLQRCSAPSPRSAVSNTMEVASVACPEFLYPVLKRTWDVALNWPFSGMDLKAKTAKTLKASAFCGAYEKLCTTLVTSRERGCWATKTASSNSTFNSRSKLVKGRMRLVLGVQLPCSGDRSFNDRE